MPLRTRRGRRRPETSTATQVHGTCPAISDADLLRTLPRTCASMKPCVPLNGTASQDRSWHEDLPLGAYAPRPGARSHRYAVLHRRRQDPHHSPTTIARARLLSRPSIMTTEDVARRPTVVGDAIAIHPLSILGLCPTTTGPWMAWWWRSSSPMSATGPSSATERPSCGHRAPRASPPRKEPQSWRRTPMTS
jgi:hypothetical protein